jgi:hypothetical protein
LFQRWLALACLTSEFVGRQIREDHPEPQLPVTDAFIICEGEIDLTVTSAEPLFPPGTTIMTVSPESLEGLEYFVGNA